MKVALLQCNSVSGDVAGNQERILAAAQHAAQAGADVCVTPELALCGVSPGEYLCTPDFAQGCRAALQYLAAALRDGPPLLVGVPVPSVYAAGLLSNAAVMIHKGCWQVASRKVYQGLGRAPGHEGDLHHFDRGISCGIISLCGWRLGVVLCEEPAGGESSFWKTPYASGHNPLMEMIQRGVDAVIHMAATPFRQGMQRDMEHVLSHVAARHHIHLFSANLVGGNGSHVYNGQSVAFDAAGHLLARGRAFAEDVLVVESGRADTLAANRMEATCACPEEDCWHALTLGVRDFVAKCGAERVVLGLSGGIDSALVCSIAAQALGPEQVTAVLMPSPHTSRASVEDALRLTENLGVRAVSLPIEPLMDGFARTLEPGLSLFPAYEGEVTFENIQTRIRGALLTSLANRARALVLNCSNKSEAAMGYCTLYGDTVGALSVIGDLSKSEVYALARWYNEWRGTDVIPQNILDKAPSAELRPNQKDSDSLPPYEELDPLLEECLRPRPDREVSPACLDVRHRLFAAEFKRRQLPPALVVSRTPFGQGWRTPLSGRYRLPDFS
ncbi:MAG: NAD(+) synthase [Desulfovibrionaceae bacterium]|nr:NAD(+) synthase [Desulfovibrionaceae bacterium]